MSADASILPTSLARTPPRRVRDLKEGESSYVVFTAMHVYASGHCYIDLNEDLRGSEGVNKIAIRRDAEGYHVTVPSDIKYERRDWSAMNSHVPVASVVMGPPEEDRVSRLEKRIDELSKNVDELKLLIRPGQG